MAALTSAQQKGLFMFLWIIGSLAAGEMKAKPGEDVTLQCNGPTNAAVTVLEWSRPGLEHYVFYFRDNEPMESFQNLRYRGRVELNNPVMNNGDVSVLLKNVNTNDTGTYQCEVITHSNNRRKRDVGNLREFVRSVHLSVSEGPEKEINDEQPGGPRGHVGLGVGLGVVCLIVVGVVGAVLAQKRALRVSQSV
ncbi:hypothetical protein OYC64_001268 [Pagothenia borchgrevinki]|uniref:Ig-like domain-containing protein n=1 Tax=Pagothenia borchgrevinki TaxID=8213 RepID=A0ABD2GB72_PAGBO